jgi:hypothetical protein
VSNETDKRLLLYQAVPIGAIVRFVGKAWRRQTLATVVEKLDDNITGMARYQVEFHEDGAKWDVCRWEMATHSRLTREKKAREREAIIAKARGEK